MLASHFLDTSPSVWAVHFILVPDVGQTQHVAIGGALARVREHLDLRWTAHCGGSELTWDKYLWNSRVTSLLDKSKRLPNIGGRGLTHFAAGPWQRGRSTPRWQTDSHLSVRSLVYSLNLNLPCGQPQRILLDSTGRYWKILQNSVIDRHQGEEDDDAAENSRSDNESSGSGLSKDFTSITEQVNQRLLNNMRMSSSDITHETLRHFLFPLHMVTAAGYIPSDTVHTHSTLFSCFTQAEMKHGSEWMETCYEWLHVCANECYKVNQRQKYVTAWFWFIFTCVISTECISGELCAVLPKFS